MSKAPMIQLDGTNESIAVKDGKIEVTTRTVLDNPDEVKSLYATTLAQIDQADKIIARTTLQKEGLIARRDEIKTQAKALDITL